MKVVVYMATSLNGMVATGQGETPWGEASWENFISATERAGTLIIGRTTYDVMKKDESFNLLRGNPHVVVVSQTSGKSDDAIWATNPKAAIEALADNDTILVGGGPGLATSMIADSLIDELHLDIEPLLLGNGLPLLSQELMRKLTLISVDRYDAGGVTLQYRVEKS